MDEVVFDGIRLRARHTIPQWGPPLIARYFRHAGGGASRNLFADVVAVDVFYPEEWSRAQRRERLTRLIDTKLEIDGRFVVRVENTPKATRSLYEKTKWVVVEPGRLSEPNGAQTHSGPTPLPTSPSSVPHVVPADGVSRAEFDARMSSIESLLRQLTTPNPMAPTPPQPTAVYAPVVTPQDPAPPPRQMVGGHKNPLPRSTMTYIIDKREADLASLRARCGLPALPRGPVGVRHSMADTAARAVRVLDQAVATMRDLGADGVEDFADLKLAPTRWEEMGPPLSYADQIIHRLVRADPDGRSIAWMRVPELDPPEDD